MRKIPMRKCVVTQERFPKKELIRVVRTPEKAIEVDLTGKKNGHGAYVSLNKKTIALARKLLALIYTMLKTGTPYNEECFEIRRKQSERKRASRMVNELQKLGYLVVAPG